MRDFLDAGRDFQCNRESLGLSVTADGLESARYAYL